MTTGDAGAGSKQPYAGFDPAMLKDVPPPPVGKPYVGFDPAALGAPSPPQPPRGYGAGNIGPTGEWIGTPLASWGQRVGASTIDAVLLLAVPLVAIVTNSAALMLIGSALYFGLWLSFMSQQGWTGQTPGKKALKIKVIREADGEYTGFGVAVLRSILHHVLDGAFCGLGYFWPLWDKRRQTFADKILATVVVTAD
jgi:uncharacterized RDD family membrane protein YckC